MNTLHEINAVLWPRRLLLEMNAYLLTHPNVDVQRMFEERVASRVKSVSLKRGEDRSAGESL